MLDDVLTPSHGGTLVNLLVGADRAAELQAASHAWASCDLTSRQLCNLELLSNGGLSPLQGFMTRTDYESVRDTLRLTDGTLCPMPITLDVPETLARNLTHASMLALRDHQKRRRGDLRAHRAVRERPA